MAYSSTLYGNYLTLQNFQMIEKAYKIAIAYFTLFSLFLLYTIVALFEEKIGFALSDLKSYYEPKSLEGLLEIASPHLMAIALFIMVITHFFLFTTKKSIKKVIALYYVSALIVILSVFIKLYIIKLVALAIFILLSLYISLLLLLQTVK